MSLEATQQNATATKPMTRFEKIAGAIYISSTVTFGLGAGVDLYQSFNEGKNMSGTAALKFSCVRANPTTFPFMRPIAGVAAAGAQLSAAVTDTVFGPSPTVRAMTCD